MTVPIPRAALFLVLAAAGCAAGTPGDAPGDPPGSAPGSAGGEADAARRSAGGDAADGSRPDEVVRNIIFMIADGAGVGAWTAAAYGRDDLAVTRMPVTGLVDTRSGSARVTDSAAGATAYAAGERVGNRTVGVGGDCPRPLVRDTVATRWPRGCEPLESWFAMAGARGKATGIVTTTSVVDATPAAFVAPMPSRYWRQAIAREFADAGLDVLLGGGRAYFDGATRTDGEDLLGRMCAEADCVDTPEGLATYRPGDRPLVGLFAPADFHDEDPRPVALPDMVNAALARLAREPEGFVAVFETEATDNGGHDNQPLDRLTADILEFDDAVAVALDFAARTAGTLVVVTADHETGGASLVQSGGDLVLEYTTTGHTANAVPVFASGPGAERFGGFRENFEIGRTLLEIVGRW